MRHPEISTLIACACLALAACSKTNLVGAQFVSSPITDVEADELYSYDVVVAGAYPPATVFDFEIAPPGMSVDADGLVTWTPSFADLGVHEVTLRVSDGVELAEQTWQLTVHQDLLLGLSYSPRGHTSTTTDQDRSDFADEHATFGRIVSYVGPWRDSLATAGTIPTFASDAMEEAGSFDFQTLIGFQWAAADGTPDLLSEADGVDNSWTNQETRDEFLMMVEGFAQTHKPKYLFLGDEVNTWALLDPAGWADWLTELEECTAAIKAVSPETQVFTVFQLEHLKGLGVNQGWADAAQWNLVDDLEAGGFLDGVGFTSLPHFEYSTPGAIPAGYYDEISAHWFGQQYFTEIGWPATANAPFPGDPTDQATLADEFLVRIQGTPVEMALWLYLHDFDGSGATPDFTDMGLRSNDGLTIRPAEPVWSAAVGLRQRPDL